MCRKIEEITGPVCIEIGPQSYVSALDNGLFTVGAPRDEGNQVDSFVFEKYRLIVCSTPTLQNAKENRCYSIRT